MRLCISTHINHHTHYLALEAREDAARCYKRTKKCPYHATTGFLHKVLLSGYLSENLGGFTDDVVRRNGLG